MQAVTLDPFIVYTSNVFAILGLRSLYFLRAGSMERFAYRKVGLAAVLVFVGAKMLVADVYHVPIAVSPGRNRPDSEQRDRGLAAAHKRGAGRAGVRVCLGKERNDGYH